MLALVLDPCVALCSALQQTETGQNGAPGHEIAFLHTNAVRVAYNDAAIVPELH